MDPLFLRYHRAPQSHRSWPRRDHCQRHADGSAAQRPGTRRPNILDIKYILDGVERTRHDPIGWRDHGVIRWLPYRYRCGIGLVVSMATHRTTTRKYVWGRSR